MGLSDIIFKGYAALLLVRLLVPEVGQMGYNPIFRWIIRLTDPVLRPLRQFVRGREFFGPLLALGGLILLQGLFLSGSGYAQTRLMELGPIGWIFRREVPLWWLGRSLFSYLVFFYQFLAFFLILSWLWRDSLAPVGRLARQISGSLGFKKSAPGLRLTGLGLVFALSLLLANLLGQRLGWLEITPFPPLAAVVVALWLLVKFITVFIVLIVARTLLSYFSPVQGEYSYLLTSLTEPFFRPLRGLNLWVERWDLTPAVAIFALLIIKAAVLALLNMILRSAG